MEWTTDFASDAERHPVSSGPRYLACTLFTLKEADVIAAIQMWVDANRRDAGALTVKSIMPIFGESGFSVLCARPESVEATP